VPPPGFDRALRADLDAVAAELRYGDLVGVALAAARGGP